MVSWRIPGLGYAITPLSKVSSVCAVDLLWTVGITERRTGQSRPSDLAIWAPSLSMAC